LDHPRHLIGGTDRQALLEQKGGEDEDEDEDEDEKPEQRLLG
jgi:hypothetical protein